VTEAFLCEAVRTPIGKFGGALALATMCVGVGQG
jgi:hypothetical protein